MKILHVDDEPDILQQTKIFLKREHNNLEIDTETSAREALEILDGNENHDAVVSDYKMPDMDGLEFLKKVREERDSDIPFIIFTGKGREEVAMDALNLGADRYIRKGGDPKSQYEILANAIFHEIETKKSEKRAAREEDLLEELMSEIPATIFFKDRESRFVRISNSVTRVLGTPMKEIIGKTDFDFYPREIAKKFRQDEKKVMETGEPIINQEEKVPFPEIGESWFLTSKVPRRNDKGKTIGTIGISWDITKRKELQKKFKFESSLLNSLLDNTPDSIYFKDRENRFVRVSQSKAEHLGMDKEDILGKTDFDFYPEEQAEQMADDKKVMETGKPIKKEEKVKRPTGEEAWVSVIKAPRYDENNNVMGTVGISRDITERKEAEERLSAVYRSSPTSITLSSLEDGRYIEVNEAFSDLTGWKREKAIGKTAFELGIWAEPAEEQRREMIDMLKEKGKIKNQKFVFKNRKGEKLIGLLSAEIITLHGEKCILSNVIDITERTEDDE